MLVRVQRPHKTFSFFVLYHIVFFQFVCFKRIFAHIWFVYFRSGFRIKLNERANIWIQYIRICIPCHMFVRFNLKNWHSLVRSKDISITMFRSDMYCTLPTESHVYLVFKFPMRSVTTKWNNGYENCPANALRASLCTNWLWVVLCFYFVASNTAQPAIYCLSCVDNAVRAILHRSLSKCAPITMYTVTILCTFSCAAH